MADLIVDLVIVLFAVALLIFIFVGIPAIVWFYVINLINISFAEKVLVFIFFYLLYLNLFKLF